MTEVHENETRATLLVTCKDRPGLVAALSQALYTQGANILDAAAQSLVDLIAEIGAFDLKAFAEESL